MWPASMSGVTGSTIPYLPPTAAELIERVEALIGDFELVAADVNKPKLAVATALAHVCYLLGSSAREYHARRAIGLELFARAHMEAATTTIFLTQAPDEALAYLTGVTTRTLRAMQSELDRHDAGVGKLRDNVKAHNSANERNNEGIAARNKREGTEIPLRPILPIPDGVLFEFDANAIIQELADDGEKVEGFSMTYVMERVRVLTAATACPLDFANWYSLGYRGLSMNAVHPTATALARYVQDDGLVWKVNFASGPPINDGLLHAAIFLTLLAAERAAEFMGVDATWFSSQVSEMDAAANAPSASSER